MAKKVKAAEQEPEATEDMEFPEPAFPPIGDDTGEEDHAAASSEEDTDATEGAEAETSDDNEVSRELAELRQALADRDRRIDTLMQGMLHNTAPQTAPQTQQTPQIDHSNIPDPVEKPEEFRKWISQQVSNAKESAAPKVDPAQAAWDGFLGREDNADLREHQRVAEAFAREKAQELAQRGLDPARAVALDPEGVLGDVAKRTRDYLNTLRSSGTSAKPNRTGGVSGGGSRSMNRRAPSPSKMTTLVDELKAVQSDDGFL